MAQGATAGEAFIPYVNYLADKRYVPPNGRIWVGADAAHICQPGGLLLDDVEDAIAKGGRKLLGEHRADALDHVAAQIFFDALLGRRRGAGEHLRLELEAEFPVLHPAALRGQAFPRVGTTMGTATRAFIRSPRRLTQPPRFAGEGVSHVAVLSYEERADTLQSVGRA
jgi:hypothetical protein